MNILMVMNAKSVGGAELEFLELANYLAHHHNVRLLCLSGDSVLQHTEVNKNIEIKIYPYGSVLFTISALISVLLENIRFSSKSTITTSFIGNTMGYVISLFNKSKLTSLQTVSVCMNHPKIDQFILKRFDVLVAGATDIKEYLISHHQDHSRIHVVHNWVDFSKKSTNKNPKEVKKNLGVSNKLVIGCIGRFHPQKGQIFLIRAFSKIVEQFPDTVLVLVGDGETRMQLEYEIEKLGLKDQVVMTGVVVGNIYNNILNTIDIYVQPSVFEGLPRTLLDAMYFGKAIVATNINGNSEVIINGENGLLVPNENDEVLFHAISDLLNAPEKRDLFSQAAKKYAGKFSMILQLRKIEALI